MLTSALISFINQEVPDWSRTKILLILNEVQKMVFTQNATSAMRMYSSTGTDPILTGTNTYAYDIKTPAFSHNAWRVYAVYTEDIAYPNKDVLTFDATPSIPYARIIFPNNVSGEYYLRCYRSPTELTTELVQLEVPEAYHLSHIYEGVMGFIEQFRSGKSERYQFFMQTLLLDLVKRMSDGQRRNSETQYSACGE